MPRQAKKPQHPPSVQARLTLHVQPGASVCEVVGLVSDTLRVKVSAPARDGKANQALIDFLSEALGVSKSRIELLKGAGSRNKVVSVDGLSREEALKRLVKG